MDGKLRSMTCVYLRREDKLLLLYRQGGRVVNNVYTGSAGGHFEPHELYDARACVLRELKEELGLDESHLVGLRLRYVTLRYMQGEIRQNYYFFAHLSEDAGELSSNEGTLRWVDIGKAMELDMPISAKPMLGHYISTGQYDDVLYAGIVNGETTVNFVAMI